MSLIPQQRALTRKPNLPKLSKTNSIAKKIEFYAPLSGGSRGVSDIVDRLSPIVTGTSKTQSELGSVRNFTYPSTLDFGDIHDIGAGGFTVGCWFNTTQNTSSSLITKAAAAGTNFRWAVNVGGGGDLQLFFVDGVSYTCGSPMVWDDGEWHLVVATVTRGVGLELFVDGVSVATTVYTGLNNINSSDVLIVGEFGNATGGAPNDNYQQFLGMLSDAFICHSALSSKEVKSLYNNFYQILQPRIQYLPVEDAVVVSSGRIMGALAGKGGLAGRGGIAGIGGGIAG